mgnify:CR=1 FL=1
MSLIDIPTNEDTITTYIDEAADMMHILGYNLSVYKVFGPSDNQRTVILMCVPRSLNTSGTIANFTFDVHMTGEHYADITGSSFDYAGPGIRKMERLVSRTNEVRRFLEEIMDDAANNSDLYSYGYAPVLLAELLAETMREAGYSA